MSLSVFYALTTVAGILFYVVLFLCWTPQHLRLTMVGAMLAALVVFF